MLTAVGEKEYTKGMENQDDHFPYPEISDPFLSLRKEEEERKLRELLVRLSDLDQIISSLTQLRKENEELKGMVSRLTHLLEESEEKNRELKERIRGLAEKVNRVLHDMSRYVQRT